MNQRLQIPVHPLVPESNQYKATESDFIAYKRYMDISMDCSNH